MASAKTADSPISPPPATGGGRFELPAYVSNGMVGLRVREIPFHDGLCMVGGFAGEEPSKRIEASARAPYPLAADISINGVAMSDTGHSVHAIDQSYDFSTGELTTRCMFAAEGVEVRLEVLTFCSRRQPTIVCQQIRVEADRACDVVLSAGLETDGIEGSVARLHKDSAGKGAPVDGSLRWQSAGGISTCGMAYVTELDRNQDSARSLSQRDGELVTAHSFRARSGRTRQLRQITCVVPGVMHSQPEMQAARLVSWAKDLSFDTIRSDNRAEWQELWKSRIKLVGADRRWQELADAAFYYLNSSVHACAPASTSIFGLATWKNYHYYYGHVMWDIECFGIPVLSLVQPRTAEAMLEFRFRTLAAAANNARLFGRGGLQFPWECASSSGEEAAPLPGTAAWHEDHVTLDVALTFAFHASATGDERFLRERAWPVLAGVAEWLETRVTRTPRGYEILRSMGIAEREQPSDNTAFTNMAAKLVLRKAVNVGQRLDLPTREKWQEIEAGLVLPERGGALVSYDGYGDGDEKGATPEPLMGLFPLGYEFSPARERETLDLYLGKAGDYVGSPMLSALYGVWAAWSGDRKLALQLLDEGYAAFMADRFLQTLEYRRDRFPEQPMAGPFFANLSGFLLGLMLGFPGVLVDEDEPTTWPRRPVVLPSGWEAIEIERLWVHGREARLVARQGAPSAVLEFY
jgi:trehalose/maltose hydrolase-like predicted phosphorylase